MKSLLSSALRTGAIGRAILLLIVLSVIMIAATAFLFWNLVEKQRGILESVREDAMWAVFQTDRETSRLIEAIHLAQIDPGPGTFQALRLRFDLVYSRGALLGDGYFAEKFSASEDVEAYAQSTQHAILQMADEIDPLSGQDAALRAALPALLKRAQEIRTQSTQLVIATNETINALRVAEREDTSQGYNRLALGVVFMIFGFVSIVALQFMQLALISNTKRKLRHLSLRNARSAQAAKAASDAKTRFLATMSHEIRTPLNGVIGAAELLKDTALSKEQQKRVSVIRYSGRLLLDVITDVLDYSKLEADAITYTFAPVYLPDLATTLETVFRPRADDAGLEFGIELPDCEVVTDVVRVRQVLVNLIGNALKFTQSGNVRVTGHVQEDRSLCLTVSDTGIGIPKSEQEKLFRDFSQIDSSASRRFSGTGLGLAISKRIVTGLGGRISVTSEAGSGSVFSVDLPVSAVEWDCAGQGLPVETRVETPMRYEARVLLVEDNEVNRDVAIAILERFGVETEIAVNGQEALDTLARKDFDLVFMDLQMPVLDGLTATTEIRRSGAEVPIVGLSANAFEEDRQKCLASGMNEYLAKPITPEQIRVVLAQFAKPVEISQEAPASADNLLDREHISSIVRHTGKDAFCKMLDKLRSDVASAADLFSEKGNGWETEERDAYFHAIKGAALTLGLRTLGDLAQEMRDAAHDTYCSAGRLLSVADASIEAARAID